MTGVIANAFLASPPRPLRKASGFSRENPSTYTIFLHCTGEVIFHTLFLDEHRLTSRHNLKDSPGRTGDSWRIRTTGVIAKELMASPPRPLRKASGFSRENPSTYTIFLHCTGEVIFHTLFLDEHRLTSRHNLKDSPGRTGDSWRIRTTGVIAKELMASPPRPLRKASGFSRENPSTYTIFLHCTGEVTHSASTSGRILSTCQKHLITQMTISLDHQQT
ncbi:hypothetical protein DV702_05195 [Sporosarcina sp. PTS2304]|nr:hypothetical protein DV702_05195 [Sporosarcina sp. PTS2304]